ncbi:FxSxx-COOH system tetratricopeptide repeat protein [Actinoplanes sp. CA-015351]|uniref:FxSxx-COOH system tetratricopeptide repeat protein n=1 Tax=Actinoplanes sp. CA-015351 TaxID=3239897 RepID=UPI003D995BA7
MGSGRRRMWFRVSWIAGALALVAFLAAAAIRQDWLDGQQPGALWTWLERVSWLAALAGLVIAILATRKSAAPPPVEPAAPATVPVTARNLPPRNPAFVGRADVLQQIKEGLTARNSLVIQALHGWGGVGKTQLSIEYAHRNAADYDVIWWFAAEQSQLLGDQYAQLAVAVGVATPETSTVIAANLVRRFLRDRPRWLVIFDNAEDPATLRPWLPDGDGHVLITSRRKDWQELAEPISIDVLPRVDSAAMLRRGTSAEPAEVDALARELGDLPLALAQAAGFMAETGMSAGDYLAGLGQRANLLLDEGSPSSYPAPLTATVAAAAQRAAAADPAAAQLLQLAAICGPEPVPLWLFDSDTVPAPLSTVVRNPVALRRSVGLLVRLGLARTTVNALQLHRLTRAILQSSDVEPFLSENRRIVERLVVAAQPADSMDPAHWPTWSALAPHILALDPARSESPELRYLATRWAVCLLNRGSLDECLTLAEQLHEIWSRRYGVEEHTTLQVAFVLGCGYLAVGRWEDAKKINERTYQARLRLLGPDDPHTHDIANELAASSLRLGEVEGAIALLREVVGKRQQANGGDDTVTLRYTGNLATALRTAGHVPEARVLHQSAWDGCKRINGENHLSSLIHARNVGIDRRLLGDLDGSQEVLADTLRRSLTSLGTNHPDTLRCAFQLGLTLLGRGDRRESRELLADTYERFRMLLGEEHPETRETAVTLKAAAEGRPNGR